MFEHKNDLKRRYKSKPTMTFCLNLGKSVSYIDKENII